MSSYTPVARDADPLANPVGGVGQSCPIGAPGVVLLVLVQRAEPSAGGKSGQDDPFGDGRSMDAGRCGNVDIAVGDERVVCPMVDASGEEVEKFEAVKWNQ